MRAKELRQATPPHLIGELSPKNNAWYLMQLAKDSRENQIHAEAVARQQGLVVDELGQITVSNHVIQEGANQ